MFDTIFGLPVHALVVHAVVILVPLGAVGGVLVALVPALTRRYASLVALVTLAAVPAVFVAQESGPELEDRVKATLGAGSASAREADLLEQHAALGGSLLPWVIVLAVGAIAFAAISHYARRFAAVGAPAGSGTGSVAVAAEGGSAPGWLVPGRWVAFAVLLVGAALSTYYVIRIGHLGAEAAWTEVVDPG